MKNLIKSLALLPLAFMFSSTSAVAGPSGLCDDLKGSPNGAYGLCVAIIEVPADDCTPVFDADGALVESSLDDCRASSRKLVDKFLERTEGTGIKLPGAVYEDPSICPCEEAASQLDWAARATFPEGFALFTNDFGVFALQSNFEGMACLVNDVVGPYSIPPVPLNSDEFAACFQYWSDAELSGGQEPTK